MQKIFPLFRPVSSENETEFRKKRVICFGRFQKSTDAKMSIIKFDFISKKKQNSQLSI